MVKEIKDAANSPTGKAMSTLGLSGVTLALIIYTAGVLNSDIKTLKEKEVPEVRKIAESANDCAVRAEVVLYTIDKSLKEIKSDIRELRRYRSFYIASATNLSGGF